MRAENSIKLTSCSKIYLAMSKKLELTVTGNENYPRDHVQDVVFGLETTRVFLVMTGDEDVAGTLSISLLGDVEAALNDDPSGVFEEFVYHTYSRSRTDVIEPRSVEPKTNLGRSYIMSKKLSGSSEGYIDITTTDDYYLKPGTTRYDHEQRRDIENLRLRSVQVRANC